MSDYLPDGCTDEMCSSAPEDTDPEDADLDLIEEDDPDEEWEFDCHMDRHGVCGAAGSEECEFECPYNRH